MHGLDRRRAPAPLWDVTWTPHDPRTFAWNCRGPPRTFGLACVPACALAAHGERAAQNAERRTSGCERAAQNVERVGLSSCLLSSLVGFLILLRSLSTASLSCLCLAPLSLCLSLYFSLSFSLSLSLSLSRFLSLSLAVSLSLSLSLARSSDALDSPPTAKSCTATL